MLYSGKLVREMRTEAGLSQAELARLARVSQAHVARIENETVDPRMSTVNRILRILRSKDRRKRCRSIMNPSIISGDPDDSIDDVIHMMKDRDISQFPVMSSEDQVGSVDEASIIKNLDRKIHTLSVKHIMDRPFPIVDGGDPVDMVQPLLDFHSAVLVSEKGKLKGIITKSDLIGMK